MRAVLFISIFFAVSSYSQEAEKLYHEQYSKFGFVLQPSKITGYGYGYDNSYPNVSINDTYSWQFGVCFNFAQSGSFNFKTGIIAKEFAPLFDLNISDEDIGIVGVKPTGFDFVSGFSIAVPIKTEYLLKINDKLNIVAGAGLNFNVYLLGDREKNIGVTFVNEQGISKNVYSSVIKQEQIGISTDVSIGANYKTNFALFQLEAFYNKNMTNSPIAGHYKIQNLVNTPDKEGSFTVKGDFYGLSLSVLPKKGWLKKK